MTDAQAPAAPSVPPGRAVYAIGDIHGESGRLDMLHSMIRADARNRGAKHNIAVYLGDYVDRGPDSAGVVDRLLGDSLPGFERVFLMGNHEEFLLQFLEIADEMSGWFHNGGLQTLESYEVDVHGYSFWSSDSRELRDALAARLPEAHREFLESLRLHHIEGDYLFVHAGIRPGRKLEEQSRSDMLWIRNEFVHSDADHGHIVVHGHTTSDVVEVRANRIGIDTGAVYGGVLTALVLEGSTREFLQV